MGIEVMAAHPKSLGAPTQRYPDAVSQNVLIVGGTAEARALAQQLVDAGVTVTSSLAGRVANPRLPAGGVRIGGFGGVAGLIGYLSQHHITHVVDATHPFAVRMRGNAVEACARASVPLLRLARPGWSHHPDAPTWHWVNAYDEARQRARELGVRPFISSGRQTLQHFRVWDTDALVRVVEPLDEPIPARWRVELDRGPYRLEAEIALMREHGTDVLITKDSGGSYTSAKLDAARALNVPVVVVRRPANPRGLVEVSSLEAVRAWLQRA